MSTFNKFQDFSEQLARGVHHFGSDTFRIALTNSAPTASMAALSEITQIAYTNISGGVAPAVSVGIAEDTGTVTVNGDQVVITAIGAVPTFQYYVLYNDSSTSPVDALVCWWDHGSAVTLANAETFTIKFNSTAVDGTIFTLT